MSADQTIKRAMVLGAGMGSRMRELTRDKPKPMVQVGGIPLVDHVLDRLREAGVRQAVVNVHYKADVLEYHLSGRTVPEITISDERGVLLDTGGGVAKALSLFENKPFFIHNADSIWLEGKVSALAAMQAAWDPDRMDSLLLLASPGTSLGYDGAGDFVMDAAGTLERRSQETSGAFVFAGVSIAHPRMFDGAPDHPFSLNLLWDRAIASGRLFGTCLDGRWMHVGTPEAVAEADHLYASVHDV